MKTPLAPKINSVVSFSLFMVFCLATMGQSAQAAATKAQLHLPWTLLENRLRVAATSNSSKTPSPIADGVLNVDGYAWNLTGTTVATTFTVSPPVIDTKGASTALTSVNMSLHIAKISVDQVIEHEVGGATVRVHLTASCGPLDLVQKNASSAAQFAIDWLASSPTNTPKSSLTNLDLSWAPNSWAVADFPCEGPEGLPDILHSQILAHVADAQEFKPYLAAFIGEKLQEQLDLVIAKVRAPLDASTGKGHLKIAVGQITPATTGLIADLTLGDATADEISATKALPTAAVLAKLAKDRPILIGDTPVLQKVISTEMNAQPDYVTLDLQTVKSFHDLMQNSFIQFFVWSDLLNFESSYPFWLRLKNPKALSLKSAGNGTLTSNLSIYAIIQAYRDKKWWSYVVVNGTGDASVALTVSNGAMSYATTITRLNTSIDYGADYKARYGKPSSIPKDTIKDAMTGKQSALSGSMTWPDVNLGGAGSYRAASITWLSKDLFTLTWNAL